MSGRGGHGGGVRQGGKREAHPQHTDDADEQGAGAGAGGSSQQGDAKRARLPAAARAPTRLHAPTVRDLITDTLAPLANAYWAPGAPQHKPFDPQIIETIYSKHLAPTNEKATQRVQREEERKQAGAGADSEAGDEQETRQLAAEEESEQQQLEHQRAQRLLLLELSAYLESYLWKHYDPSTASFAHVMSFVMLVNQKFKGENRVGIWEPFHDRPEHFRALLDRISRMKTERDLTLLEANQLLAFFIHAFESFEEPAVRGVFMRLASVDSWRSLRDTSIMRELRSGDADAAASAAKKKDAKDAPPSDTLRSVWPRIAAKPATDFAAAFLPNLLSEFVHILYSIDDDSKLFKLDSASRPGAGSSRRLPYALRDHVLYLERFLEFIIGLLAKLSTRRWTKKLIEEIHLLVLCQQSPLVRRTREKERALAAQQAAMAARSGTAGSDAMDLEVLSATTATTGGAILSLSNRSNTNGAVSASTLPGRLFCQLLDMVQRFLHFEVDDVTGQQLPAQEVLNRHYLDVQILQKVCFKMFADVPQLLALALANVSRIDDADKLAEMLQGLTTAQLRELCVAMQLLPRDEEVELYKHQAAVTTATPSKKKAAAAAAPTHVPRLIVPLLPYMQSSSFLLSLLQSAYVLRPSTLSSIQSMPLYPSESLLFDEHAIPSINYTGDTVLALPKLNLQFLTLHDYLQRNFQLYKSESTYEIREDIAYTLKRIKPRVGDDGSTVFTGWARMACPLISFAVTGVAKPLIGETKPSSVRAEITIDLSVFNGVVREEWEALRMHDVLFLLSVQALTPISHSSAAGAVLHARQQGDSNDRFKGRKKADMDTLDLESGLAPEEEFHSMQQEPLLVRFVRGARVQGVLDGHKKLIGERDDKGNVYKPRGSVRTFRVELDAAQYGLDQHAEVVGRALNGGSPVSDVYSSFNLVLRRKPKENNFAGVLETIRNMMTETHSGVAGVPSWFAHVFLGYGNPRDSQYYSLPDQLERIEFVDTFVDLKHLKDSFHEEVVLRGEEEQAASGEESDAAAAEGNNSSTSLLAIAGGTGDANNRQTAAATSIQLTRQVMRLVAAAQKEKAAAAGGDAAAAAAADAATQVDTTSSTFRVTFPLKVQPNYEVLQQLLYVRGAGELATSDASKKTGLLAEGAETLRAERALLAKKKVKKQDGDIEEGEVEEGEVPEEEEEEAEEAGEENMADATEGTEAEAESESEQPPAPFTMKAPVFDMVEPVKPTAAAASSSDAAAAALAAAADGDDVESQISALSQLTVPKLRDQLKSLNEKSDGVKAVLIERLAEVMREKAKAKSSTAEAPAAAAAGSDDADAAAGQYEKDLAAYNAAKAAHEEGLQKFQAAEAQHQAAVAAFEKKQAKSQSKAKTKSTKKKADAAAAADADTEMTDAEPAAAASASKKKRASRGKKGAAAEEEAESATPAAAAAAVPAAAASSTPAASAVVIPPSPHTLSVELLPRVHARHDYVRRNQVRFTPIQVEAIKSGLNPGLTMIVGPPGTGKTDTAVQIISELYHNFPEQRTLLVTHSNSALNDLFQKIMERDISERYLLRLGRGSEDVQSASDMGKFGRVNFMLQRRLDLLEEVGALASSMGLNGEDAGYTCETSGHFFLQHVLARWEKFVSTIQTTTAGQGAAAAAAAADPSIVQQTFPFTNYFEARADKQAKIWAQYYGQQQQQQQAAVTGADGMEVDGASAAAAASSAAPAPASLFRGVSLSEDMSIAASCFADLQQTFLELEETRPFELLRNFKDRGNYLLSKHAKIIAMTCTHAAIKRGEMVDLNFRYDNIIMEESAQILEIETFIPMLLQRYDTESGGRLKRIIMLGDHNQLPPVIKNRSLQRYSHMDQSLFTRFIRLGMPYIQLNAQGRMRGSLASLWNWQYKDLGNLPAISHNPAFIHGNVGFAHEYQLINVEDLNGVGESSPTPFFYQNLGEAEYVVQTYMYMRLLGYPAHKITILTTYNGQKHLIRDILAQRCGSNLLFGLPAKVQTVDKFQGQQNDYILLSLVRTRTAGHLRDVRRLVVAMSRARLGLYVFARMHLYTNCFELTRTFNQLLHKPIKLQLLPQEKRPMDQPLATTRLAAGVQAPEGYPTPDPAALPPAVLEVRDVVHMGELVGSMTLSVQSEYTEYQRRIFAAQEEARLAQEQRAALQRQYEEAREASRREDARLAAMAERDADMARENDQLQRQHALTEENPEEAQRSAAAAAAASPVSDSESDEDDA